MSPPRSKNELLSNEKFEKWANRVLDKSVTPLGISAPPPISVSCDAFEGTLGTLFLCVKNSKIDLQLVPIFPICEAYFVYILGSTQLNLDEAGAALVALSYLLERKAWGLLPTPEEAPEEFEEENGFEAIGATGYLFETAVSTLQVWKEERDRLYFREGDSITGEFNIIPPLKEIRISELSFALERVLSRAAVVPTEPKMFVRKSLGEIMTEVIFAISDTWKSLDILVPESTSISDVVYWFLALLELIRLGQVDFQYLETDETLREVQFRRMVSVH